MQRPAVAAVAAVAARAPAVDLAPAVASVVAGMSPPTIGLVGPK